jgi:hypothetical protein
VVLSALTMYVSTFMRCPIVATALALAAPTMARAEVAAAGPLTQPQLDAFAQLVGEDTTTVMHHLSSDPALIPLARAAADTRRSRRNVGAAMTSGGFTLLGLGLIVGGVLVVSGITPSGCQWEDSTCDRGDNDGAVHAGFAIMLVSMLAGPAIAIPGIVKMARSTQLEADALAHYRASAPSAGPLAQPAFRRAFPGGEQARPFSIRLFSFTF